MAALLTVARLTRLTMISRVDNWQALAACLERGGAGCAVVLYALFLWLLNTLETHHGAVLAICAIGSFVTSVIGLLIRLWSVKRGVQMKSDGEDL